MSYLRRAGYPVPAVHAVDGPDLVMERLHGQTMAADLARRPWRVARHARALARLHDQLHQIAPPASLPDLAGQGGQVMHLDLHPLNVMLTPDGPVVIDWTNARAGPAGADVAMTYVLLTTSDLDGVPPWLRPAVRALIRLFLRKFLQAVSADPAPYLPGIISHRMRDVSVRPAEAARLRRLAERAERPGPEPGPVPSRP
jgi:aminoglycoside phosphotransferase (APT) family kinase protein